MTDTETLRRKLEITLHDQSVAAGEKALSLAPIDEELKKVEQIDNLLKHIPRSNRKLLYAVGLVGGACLVVASILWTFRLPTARIQITATTESLAMRLREDERLVWSGNWDLGSGLFRLQDMSRIEVPPELYQSRVFEGHAWLEIKSTDADKNAGTELTYLAAGPNTNLYFNKVTAGLFEMRTSDGAVLGELEVMGSPTAEAGSSREESISLRPTHLDPGIVAFSHQPIASQAFMRFTPKDYLNLPDLRVRGLSFAKENTGPQTPFRSGLISGELVVLSTGEKVKLESGSRLRLEGAKGVISRLAIGPKESAFFFDGDVRSATLGPVDYERELKPSLLEYLFHQQRLGFFWGSASFLWGLLWGARALFK